MDDFNKIPNIYPNLTAIPLNANISNEQQFRLNKINEIKYNFLAEISKRGLISKNITKYIASLDYFDKSLNVLSIISGSICNCYWSTCRKSWGKLRPYVFSYIRICKSVFENSKK